MKRFLFIVFLAFSQFAFGQVRVNLDNLLSVTFPVNPTKTKTDADSYVYSANQNGAYYIAIVKDMSKQTPALDGDAAIAQFYTKLIDTALKKQNGKLIYKENLTIADNKAIAFGYSLAQTTFPDTRFERSVYADKKLISFAFWTFKDKLQAFSADRDVFFKSITKPDDSAPEVTYQGQTKTAVADTAKTTTQQTVSKTPKSRTGYYVGGLLGALILTAFIIGLLIIIKRTSQKNK